MGCASSTEDKVEPQQPKKKVSSGGDREDYFWRAASGSIVRSEPCCGLNGLLVNVIGCFFFSILRSCILILQIKAPAPSETPRPKQPSTRTKKEGRASTAGKHFNEVYKLGKQVCELQQFCLQLS